MHRNASGIEKEVDQVCMCTRPKISLYNDICADNVVIINLCALTVFWQAHKKLEGLDKTEAIEKAIELSKKTLTYEGLFFDVKVHAVESHRRPSLLNPLFQPPKIIFLMSNCLIRAGGVITMVD